MFIDGSKATQNASAGDILRLEVPQKIVRKPAPHHLALIRTTHHVQMLERLKKLTDFTLSCSHTDSIRGVQKIRPGQTTLYDIVRDECYDPDDIEPPTWDDFPDRMFGVISREYGSDDGKWDQDAADGLMLKINTYLHDVQRKLKEEQGFTGQIPMIPSPVPPKMDHPACSDIIHCSLNHVYSGVATFSSSGEIEHHVKNFTMKHKTAVKVAKATNQPIPRGGVLLCPLTDELRAPKIWDVIARLHGVPYKHIHAGSSDKKLGKGVLGDKMSNSLFQPGGREIRVHEGDDQPLPRGDVSVCFGGTDLEIASWANQSVGRIRDKLLKWAKQIFDAANRGLPQESCMPERPQILKDFYSNKKNKDEPSRLGKRKGARPGSQSADRTKRPRH